jgi:hypothetical protein
VGNVAGMIIITAIVFGLFGFAVAAFMLGSHRQEPDIETPEQCGCEHYYTED